MSPTHPIDTSRIHRWTTLVGLSISVVALMLGLGLQLVRPPLLELVVGALMGRVETVTSVAYGLAAVLAFVTAWRVEKRTGRWRIGVSVAALAGTFGLVHGATSVRAVTAEQVSYSASDGTLISATLYKPRGTPIPPALVMVHGSPPLRRHAYDVWARMALRRGFAVLLADKRGVGKSGGLFDNQDNTGEANIARLEGDVRAAVDFLATRADIDTATLGLIGVSQAGWVAPRAAAGNPRVKLLALITAPPISTREEGRWSRLRGDDRQSATTSRAAAEQILDTLQPRGVDARVSVRRLAIPSIWFFGNDDNSIPTRKSVAFLDSVREAGAQVTVHRYDAFGHALIGRGGGIFPTFPRDFERHLGEWLDLQSGRSR